MMQPYTTRKSSLKNNVRVICTTCFQTDSTPPTGGIVWDSISVHDRTSGADTNIVEVSFAGFTDDESYIDHYEWCVGSNNEQVKRICHMV